MEQGFNMGEARSVNNKWWFEGRTALLVEDNELAHDLGRAIMDKVGIDIDICVNGAEALQAVQSKSYDFVLMDIQMPIMDGLQATREIRKLGGAMASLPIIAMTANVDRDDIKLAHDAGMNAHIGKPINKELLYKTISGYINTSTETESAGKVNSVAELDLMPKITGIDTEDGLQRIAGNLDAYMLMLRNFAASYSASAGEIESYLNNGDFEKAVQLTHSIKGNGGNIGAKDLHKCASELESACKNHAMDIANDLLPAFNDALSQVISSLHSLPEVSSMPRAENPDFDSALWSQKSVEYIQLLDTDFAAATDGLHELKFIAADRYSKEMLILEKCIENFDVDSARKILQDINNQA